LAAARDISAWHRPAGHVDTVLPILLLLEVGVILVAHVEAVLSSAAVVHAHMNVVAVWVNIRDWIVQTVAVEIQALRISEVCERQRYRDGFVSA